MIPVTRMQITSVTEIGGLQYVSGRTFAGEYLPRVLWAEGHGHASSPPIGAVGVVMAMGGNRDQMICMAAELPGGRPTGLGAGHAVIYDGAGNQIYIGAAAIKLKAPSVEIESGSLTHNGVNIGATHVHGGVATGGADTTAPH